MVLINRYMCDDCSKDVFVEFLQYGSYNNRTMSFRNFYITDDGIFCDKCVHQCMTCDYYIKINYDNCNNCEKKILIKNTINDITRTLPVEIVFQIINFIL
jgi:hypothetical protein